MQLGGSYSLVLFPWGGRPLAPPGPPGSPVLPGVPGPLAAFSVWTLDLSMFQTNHLLKDIKLFFRFARYGTVSAVA